MIVQHECDEALVLLGTGRKALQVRAHAGHDGLGIDFGELEGDVAVNVLETHLTGDFGLPGSEDTAQDRRELLAAHRGSSGEVMVG
jgi:hypothetical protein